MLLRRHRPLLKKVDRYVWGLGKGFSFFYLLLFCLVLVANLEARAFKIGSESDGFAIIQAFAFLSALVTLVIGLGKHPTLRLAAGAFGLGALGIDQGGDLTQKFFSGSTPFKDQAVQVFLWVQMLSGALVMATSIALVLVGLRYGWRWAARTLSRMGRNARGTA